MTRKRGLFHRLALTASVLAGLNMLPSPDAPAQTQTAPDNNKVGFGPRVQKGGGQKAPGQKAPAGQRAPAPETVAVFDDWKVQCEIERPRKTSTKEPPGEGSADASGKSDSEAVPKAEASPRRVCGMIQTTRSEKVPQIGLSMFIARARQGDKTQTQMRLLAPIGVYLPLGVGVEIDGSGVTRVPFSRCLPQFCVALAEASPETLDKMIKGEAATFFLYQGPGAGLPLKISLKGFGKALAALDSQ